MSTWELIASARYFDRDEAMVVCYRRDSGETHLISRDACEVLNALAAGPATESSLLKQLHDEADSAEVLEYLRDLLFDLEDAGLVAPA